MKKLWMVFFLTLAGCGVGLEDSTGPNVDREIKNEKLRAEYESVKGTYGGFVRLNGSTKRFPVKLYLWTAEVQEAPTPGDLKPGVRVVLRGRLMQQDFIGDSDNLIMTGQYDSLSGRLRLDADVEISKTTTGCRLGGQDPMSIAGTVASDGIGGTVLRNGQVWATLEEIRRGPQDVGAGSILSEEQEYRRLIETYRPVIGTYGANGTGQLTRRVCGNDVRHEPMSAVLYIERVQEGTGANNAACYVPRLSLRTLREYEGELADVTYRSINRFDPDHYLPEFIPVTSKFASKVDLDFINNRLQGIISTTGRWGTFDLEKNSEDVVAPGDELLLLRERLQRTYARFTGLYRGYNRPPTGSRWPVKLNVYVDEEEQNGLRVPVLKGLYTRPDMSDESIGARLMDAEVSIDGCQPVLIMKSDARPGNGNGGIPGVGLMRFDATYSEQTVHHRLQKTLTGALVDHRGPQGDLTVTQ